MLETGHAKPYDVVTIAEWDELVDVIGERVEERILTEAFEKLAARTAQWN